MRRTLSIVAVALAMVFLAGAGWFDEDGVGLWGADPVPETGTPEFATYADLPSSGNIDGDHADTADTGRRWEYVGTRGGDAINTWLPLPWATTVTGFVSNATGPCYIDVPAGDDHTTIDDAGRGWTYTAVAGTSTVAGSYIQFTSSGGTAPDLRCSGISVPGSWMLVVEATCAVANTTDRDNSCGLWVYDGTRRTNFSFARNGTADAIQFADLNTGRGGGPYTQTAYDRWFVVGGATQSEHVAIDGSQLNGSPSVDAYTVFASDSLADIIQVYAGVTGTPDGVFRIKRLYVLSLE